VREQGNLKIRDHCIRAKVAAKEKHLRVDREPRVAVEKMVTAFVAGHIETNEERKQRLCALKLQILTERKRRARIPIRFDTGDEGWRRPLLMEQAEGRGFRCCQG
jgi:hypothetical protein